MKRTIFIVLLTVIAFAFGWRFSGSTGDWDKPVPVGAPTDAPEGAEWIDLLSEEHRDAWGNISDDDEIFVVENDMLHVLGRSLKLKYVGYTAEYLDNFELHLELKVAPGANSGIFLRSQPNDPVYRGFEVQVIDDNGTLPNINGSGSIYNVVTPMFNMALPAGEWNSYDIRLYNDEIEVTVNGWLVVKTDFSKMTTPLGKFDVAYKDIPLSGMLMFQDHGGEAWYRNIRLKKLDPPPADLVETKIKPEPIEAETDTE